MKDNKHTIGSGLDDEWAASHGLRTGSMLNDLIIDQKKRVRNNSEVTLVGEKGLKFFADLISLVGAFAAAYAVIRIYEYQIEWYWPVAAFFLAGTIINKLLLGPFRLLTKTVQTIVIASFWIMIITFLLGLLLQK